MSDITQLLSQAELGDPQVAERLLPLVYDELRQLAAARLLHERPGQTLQATALVHEAYLRLVGNQERSEVGGRRSENLTPVSCPLSPVSFSSRGHFFAAAAEAMRRILIEQARRRESLRRGGGRAREPLDEVEIAAPQPSLDPVDLLALDEVLAKFERVDPKKAQLVKLRSFVGMTLPEAAQALGISDTTADRYWAYARAWLHAELKKHEVHVGDGANL